MNHAPSPHHTVNALRLAGDGDDVDLLADIAHVFGISISDAEAEGLLTVGDLQDLIVAKIAPASDAPCLSARAFHELRPVLQTGGARVRPSTPLSALDRRLSDRNVMRSIRQTQRLSIDATEHHSVLQGIAIVGLLAAVLLMPELWAEIGPLAILPLAVWAVMVFLPSYPTRLQTNMRTVGDLIRRCMGRTYRELLKDGETGNRADIWLTLCALCRDHTGHTGPIDRNTRFYQ
jgi:hypothetical protein